MPIDPLIYPVAAAKTPLAILPPADDFTLVARTTDATPTRLTADGLAPNAANTGNLPSFSAASGRLFVTARCESGGNGKASWAFDVMFRRDTSVATCSASPPTAAATAPQLVAGTVTGWSVTVDSSETNGGLSVTVAGVAGQTVKWSARFVGVDSGW